MKWCLYFPFRPARRLMLSQTNPTPLNGLCLTVFDHGGMGWSTQLAFKRVNLRMRINKLAETLLRTQFRSQCHAIYIDPYSAACMDLTR